MKKLLNTLYITKQESYLHKERETIVVKNGDDKLGQFPALTVGNILCFGQISVSPFLMGYCAEQGIGLSFYTEYGRFLARVQGKQSGNVLLRRAQYRWADDSLKSVAVARLMVSAKIANTRSILLRELRNHGENTVLALAVEKLAVSLRRVKNAVSVPELMGMEGDAAATYFSIFNELLRGSGFVFGGRVKRPPVDPVNALLSFVYSLITQECVSALQELGLIPMWVFYIRTGRADRALLSICWRNFARLGQIDSC
jgi:CRISPR-associated protein Cas1